MKSGKILILEDDPVWQYILQDALEEDYYLTTVSNKAAAEQALDLARKTGEPFNLVTVDIGLNPDQSLLEGENILSFVNRHHTNTKCIVVTGNQLVGRTKLRNYFKELDVFDFIGKDQFDLNQFKQIVDEAFYLHGYRILAELGRGGMGTVYKMLDPDHDNRIVAVKVLHRNAALLPDEENRLLSRFKQEVETVQKLNHPNIVTVYDYFVSIGADGHAFFVMEYLPGPTLSQILTEARQLPLSQIVNIGIQLCEALTYAHQQGVVHRDIKPSNIILEAETHLKVTDFGVAKVLDRSTSITQDEEIVGTLDYMPPEQITNPKSIDHRVDIYATGVLLYELLCNQKPYPNPLLKLDAQPIPLRPFPPSVPSSIAHIVLKALAILPINRYQTADEMGEALRQVDY